MSKQVRILIADDHDIVRRGLRPLVESVSGCVVCGEAVNGREAVEMATELQPDIVVLDVAMPELNGIEATRLIKEALPEVEILAFTADDSEAIVRELFAAGARSCVLKAESDGKIVPAIEALIEHRPYFGSRIAEIVFESYVKTATSAAALTPRERDIVRLLADGLSNKEVGTELDIATKTVEAHRAAIMKKLGIESFAELVRYAVRNKIVQP